MYAPSAKLFTSPAAMIRLTAVAALLFALGFFVSELSPSEAQSAGSPGRILTSNGCAYGGIVEFNTDATNSVFLTADTINTPNFYPSGNTYVSFDPSVSRLTGMIAFESNRNEHGENPNRQSRIYVMNGDGSNVRRLTPEPAAGEARATEVNDQFPAISPDGSRVAFISNRRLVSSGGNTYRTTDVYIINTDGTGLRQVTPSEYNVSQVGVQNSLRAVTWSPDGTKLAYWGERLTDPKDPNSAFESVLATINPDGSNETYLFLGYHFCSGSVVDWSPDGSRILFYGGERNTCHGSNVINLYNVASKTVTPFPVSNFSSDAWNQAGGARFSPDGSQIVYWSGSSPDGSGKPQISIANLDGSNAKVVTDAPTCRGGLAWASGAAIGKPTRLDLIPNPASIYKGGPSVQMTAILYDANNNVLARAAEAWGVGQSSSATNPASEIVVDNQGLIAPHPQLTTAPDTQPFCAFNGGVKTCVNVLVNPTTNPIDTTDTFVRQQYADFLNRAPDQAGLDFWTNQITSCNGNAQCIDSKRVNVSAAYFLSTEFQETGFYVIKVQRVAFGKVSNDAQKRITYQQFAADATQVSNGVVVGQANASQILDQNKTAYAQAVAGSSAFIAKYPTTLSAAQFVDALFQTANVTPQGTERQDAITAFGSGDTAGRASALRKIAESNSVKSAELTAAFVLLEYFGYLRRNPTDLPDTSDAGYQFWLGKLNQFNGDYIASQMVRSFIVSQEYRQRFGSQ